MEESKTMYKWMFIIRPNRLDVGQIIHWSTEKKIGEKERIEKEMNEFIEENFPGENAGWMLTDYEFENILSSENISELIDIFTDNEEKWLFVDAGYIARAILIETKQAFDVESLDDIDEMVKQAEEMLEDE